MPSFPSLKRAFAALITPLVLLAGCDCDGSQTGQASIGVTLVEPAGEPDDFERELAFGSVRVAKLATKAITLRNDGRATANITNVSLTTSSPDFLLVGADERPRLEPGATWSLELRYVPGEIGEDTATIVIETDLADTAKYTIHVTGTGAASRIEVCSTNEAGGEICASEAEDGTLVVDLGVVKPGQTQKKPLVVKNLGDAQLFATRIAPTVTTSNEFTLSPETEAFEVAPGASVSYEVTYAPVDGGDDEGAIEIMSDDPGSPRTLVLLKAVGLAPKLCVEPLAIDFGDQDVGTTAKQTLALVSCGREALNVTNVVLFAGARNVFTMTGAPTPPFTMAVDEHLELEVSYTPPAFGEDADGVASFFTETPSGPVRGYVPLKGRGVGCTLSPAPSTVAFGSVSNGGRTSKTVQLRNQGTGDCVVTEIQDPAAPFVVDAAPELPLTIKPGQAERLVVAFAPTSTGAASSQVMLVSNDPRGDLPVNLSGSGITPPPCDLQAQPSSVAFTGISTGQTATQNILLTNFGTDSCYVAKAETTAGSSPAFSAVIPGSGFQQAEVVSGGTLSVPVKFAPTTAGVHTGVMRFTYGEDDFPQILPFPLPGTTPPKTLDVPLEGGTLEPSLCLDPPELDFGTVAAGGQRELNFAIKSCGAGALQVRGVNIGQGSSTEFSIVAPPRLPTYVAAGQSLSIRVLYKPLTASADFGTVAVLTNDPSPTVDTVKLKANGATSCGDRQLACSVEHLRFPTLEIGRGSSLSVTCQNVGTAAVNVTGARLASGSSAEFKANAGVVPQVVPPGGVLRVEVTYLPQDAGNDTGRLVIDGDSCDAPEVSLEGSGKQPTYPPCPPQQVFQPVVKWDWTGGSTIPASKNVGMSPVVVNLTDDNGDGLIDENDIPDVVFTSCKSGECCINCMGTDLKNMDLSGKGMLRAVHGKDGRDLWSVTDPNLMLAAVTQIAAGDINGDNVPEIIAVKHHFQPGTGDTGMEGKYKRGTLLVFDNTGRLMFETEEWTGDEKAAEQTGAPTLGDIDGDGQVEIFFERTIFNSTGKKLLDLSSSGNAGHGSFVTLSDLDGDGKLDIVSGHKAFRLDGSLWWTAQGLSNAGETMVVDVDGDGKPEVVIRDRANRFQIFDGTNGQKKYGPYEWSMPKDNEGNDEGICAAPMAAADLDGDGLPEIIAPSGDYIYAYKHTGQQMWRMPIYDYGGQCGAAGAAAFDFEGDGKYEVVYHDTSHMFVFRGTDGTKIYDAPRNSSTLWETPVIADVDNDGHADLVMTNENGILDLGQTGAGVKVLSNQGNTWPATRRIWNQHSYHVSDVNENGTIPRQETPHYKTTNSWRTQHSLCKRQ